MVKAGLQAEIESSNPQASLLLKGIQRITVMNSAKFLMYFKNIFSNIDQFNDKTLTAEQRLMWNMFIYTIWGNSPKKCGFQTYHDVLDLLQANPTIFSELKEVIQYLLDENIALSQDFHFQYPCPLELHCCYTLDQIFAAFGYHTFEKKVTSQQGVIPLKEKKTQLLLITLNKREKDYTPTTVYKDYSISEELFHWQTQSDTDVDSDKGQLYINALEKGYQILLFVRQNKQKENGITPPYYFLGDAIYRSHEGSRPMNIIWKLNTPIPAFLLQQTNKFTIS